MVIPLLSEPPALWAAVTDSGERCVKIASPSQQPEDGLLIVAVGDGLGSFPYSHFAATWACQAACKLLADQISALRHDVSALRPEAVLAPVNDGLFDLRQALSMDFATTLVVGAVYRDASDHAQVWLARVGDSTVAALSRTPDGDPQWQFLFDDQTDSQGVATTKTNAVPDPSLRYEHKLTLLHRGTALFLLTDGVKYPLGAQCQPSGRIGQALAGASTSA